MGAVGGTAAQAGNRGKTHDRNVLLEKPDSLRAEAGKEERSFDGMDIGGIGSGRYRASGCGHPHGVTAGAGAQHFGLSGAVDGQHLGYGGDACDWFLAELSDSYESAPSNLPST